MIKHYHPQIHIATLLICLCVGSLVALPMGNILGMSAPEMVGFEFETDNPFEHIDYDEELIIKILGTASDDFLLAKSRSTNIGFQDSLLIPTSPPPKHP